MKFKMNKVAIAVTASLGVSLVGMNVAQSDEVLFPYVVASPTVTTIMSVINDGATLADADALHYRYYTKADPLSKSSGCNEVDFRRVSSPNDVVTYDVNNTFGSDTLGVLFEDPADQINADYTAANQSFAGLRNVPKPLRGFAIVDNNDLFQLTQLSPALNPAISPLSFVVLDDTEASVHGEAIILEFGSGAAWGYSAYNAAGIYGSLGGTPLRLNPYDFSDRVEVNGDVVSAALTENGVLSGVATPLLPFAEEGGEFNTRLFVTPVSSYQLQSNLTTRVRFTIQNETLDLANDVMFDRDENPVSGQVPMDVTCVAALNAAEMMTLGARGEAPNGGWTNVRVEDPGSGSTQVGEAIVIKLEFNEDGSSFNGEPISLAGSFNNSLWLRAGIRESLTRDNEIGLPGAIPVFQVGDDANSPCPRLDLNAGQDLTFGVICTN